MNNSRHARIGGGDKKRKVRGSGRREEGVVHLHTGVRGTVGVDHCDLVDFDVCLEAGE